MEYRAVGNRCAVCLQSLKLPVTDTEALKILRSKKFEIREIDLVAVARRCIRNTRYRRGARPSEAPEIVDCSSFVKWLYGQRGIWLPRRSIQQREFGVSVPVDEIIAGDVVFVSGCINYYQINPLDGVGHVGMATGEKTVIHAADKKVHVVESSLKSFIGKIKFRGVRRYIPKDQSILTLTFPPDQDIETADDLRWIVLQSLSKK